MCTTEALEELRKSVRINIAKQDPTLFGWMPGEPIPKELSEMQEQNLPSRTFNRANWLVLIPVNEMVTRIKGAGPSFMNGRHEANILYKMIEADGLLRYETTLFLYGISETSELAAHVNTLADAAGFYGIDPDEYSRFIVFPVFKQFIDEFESVNSKSIRNLSVYFIEHKDINDTCDWDTRILFGMQPNYDSFAPLGYLKKKTNYETVWTSNPPLSYLSRFGTNETLSKFESMRNALRSDMDKLGHEFAPSKLRKTSKAVHREHDSSTDRAESASFDDNTMNASELL